MQQFRIEFKSRHGLEHFHTQMQLRHHRLVIALTLERQPRSALLARKWNIIEHPNLFATFTSNYLACSLNHVAAAKA